MTERNQQTTGNQTYDKMDGSSDSSLKCEYGCLNYIVGKVVSVLQTSIVFENNYLGYIIHVANPNAFEINKVKKLYVLKIGKIRNNFLNETIYGFASIEEKEAFISNGYRFTKVAKSSPDLASKSADLVKALKSLGYNSSEIEYAADLTLLNPDNVCNDVELSDLISQAIRHIAMGTEVR
ncbi:MAG: hypothetical protein LBS76_02485 [Mycoplasmataceae bacterium]|jgi:Holliday junction resolvasome RuvABC DNA-binding subunit|nr:hypothetical protein [Mycoplasmataceae bacterium]